MRKLIFLVIFISLTGCATLSIDMTSAKKVIIGADSYFLSKPDIKNETGGDFAEIFSSGLSFSLKKKNYRVESYYTAPGEEKNFRYRLVIRGSILKTGGVFDASESASIYISVYDSTDNKELALIRVICSECGFTDTSKISDICSKTAEKIDGLVKR